MRQKGGRWGGIGKLHQWDESGDERIDSRDVGLSFYQTHRIEKGREETR